MAEVAGADEQDVDAVDGGDLLDGVQGGQGLDLDDAEDVVVGPVEGAGVEAVPAHPVVGRDSPVPGRRVAQVPDAGGGLRRRCRPGGT